MVVFSTMQSINIIIYCKMRRYRAGTRRVDLVIIDTIEFAPAD